MNIKNIINTKLKEEKDSKELVTMFENQMTNFVNDMTNFMSKSIIDMNNKIATNLIEKDKQIDRANENVKTISNLVGMRSINTMKLSKMLKAKLQLKYNKRLWKDTKEFVEGKQDLFDYFGVRKWEDIPVIRYNEVEEYIKNIKIK